MNPLKSKLIRLAHNNPPLRETLIPLLVNATFYFVVGPDLLINGKPHKVVRQQELGPDSPLAHFYTHGLTIQNGRGVRKNFYLGKNGGLYASKSKGKLVPVEFQEVSN